MQVAYPQFPAITVDDSEPFHSRVVGMLDQIRSLNLGRDLMFDVQQSNKSIGIAPLRRGQDTGNKCVAHNPKKFFRLRLALGGFANPHGQLMVSIKEELTYTLDLAERMGQNRMFLAKQIVRGMTPATVRTANNLVHGPRSTGRQNEMDQAWTMAQLLEALAAGKVSRDVIPTPASGEYGLADYLVRILRPWMRPGDGSNSGIYFDPTNAVSCAGDKGMAWRPPAIGLAHELCHAWRNATGQRLFDDAQASGLDDDEVMTTGIPPYTYEKFSENKFRAVWPVSTWDKWRHWTNELPMRDSYR
jgi:hypothetical protein